MSTTERLSAPSGNRDSDRWQANCTDCGWTGVAYSNRTIEGRRLADRDAQEHVCRALYKICRECHGWGMVELRYNDGMRSTEDCRHCAGTGEELGK